MNASEGPRQICEHVWEGTVLGGKPGHDDIVEAVFGFAGRDLCNGSLQPAPDAVPDDGPAELLGHGEAEPGSAARGGLLAARLGFEQANRHGGTNAAAHSKKFTS